MANEIMGRAVRAREHVVTPEEAEFLRKRVAIRDMGTTKGRGVVARHDLQKGEFVGVLAGRVVPDAAHVEMTRTGMTSGRYAMETADKNGFVYVVEPEEPWTQRAAMRFKSSVGHYINEPAPGERLNVAWVRNARYDPIRIDCYTARRVKAGEELLIHYGDIYARKYRDPHERPLVAAPAKSLNSRSTPDNEGGVV